MKSGSALSQRWILGRLDNHLGLRGVSYHGHHNAHRTYVEHASDEVVLRGRHANKGHDGGSIAAGDEVAHGLNAPAGVLHII